MIHDQSGSVRHCHGASSYHGQVAATARGWRSAFQILLLLLCATILLSSCSSPATGTLRGTLDVESELTPGSLRPVAGTLTLSGPGGQKTTIRIPAIETTFSVRLPVGAYTVTGKTASFPGKCQDLPPVTVDKGQTANAAFICKQR